MTSSLLVLRHGRAKNNDTPSQGEPILEDAPLTEAGREQLVRLARSGVLAPYQSWPVYSSQLSRAVESARILFSGVEVARDAAFNEITTTLHEDFRYHVPDAVLREHLHRSDKGESILEMYARSVGRAGRLLRDHRQAVIVSHAGVLNALYHHFVGVSLELFPVLHVENACGILLSLEQGRLEKLAFISS